jgi:hypothetical protein
MFLLLSPGFVLCAMASMGITDAYGGLELRNPSPDSKRR